MLALVKPVKYYDKVLCYSFDFKLFIFVKPASSELDIVGLFGLVFVRLSTCLRVRIYLPPIFFRIVTSKWVDIL